MLSENPRSLLEAVALGILLILVVVAPWPFGGYYYEHQFWFWLAAGVCIGLTCLHVSSQPQFELPKIPNLLVPACGLLLITGLQLVPVPGTMSHWNHAVWSDWLLPLAQREAWSIDPSLTRTQFVRFGCALGLVWAAAHLFEDPGCRRSLWWFLGLNGAALTLFGIYQRFTWNGLLFWVVELTYGGQPFASYVNRNHAAGYLHLCLAGSLAIWWWTQHQETADDRDHHRSRSRTWQAWAAGALVFINLIGIVASLSRGGILAAVVACLVVVLLAEQVIRIRLLALCCGGILMLGIVLANTSLKDSLTNRFGEFESGLAGNFDGRIQHWQDTFPITLDAPWGTGLGTYRLANRPYQAHATAGEFHNADNLYFELLVELGWLGLALVLAGIACVAWRIRQLSQSQLPHARQMLVMGSFLLVAQGLQAATDFGVLMTANLVTLATLLGCLYSREIDPGHESSFDEKVGGRGWHLGLGTTFVVFGLLTYVVMDHVSRVELFRRNLPPLGAETPRQLIDERVAQGRKLLDHFPDDSVLLNTLGSLSELGYRQLMLVEVKEAFANQPRSPEMANAWLLTSPTSLFQIDLKAVETGALRSHPAIAGYLTFARSYYRDLRRSSPAHPGGLNLLAATAPLLGHPEEPGALAYWQAEAALLPDDDERLLALGRLVQLAGDEEAANRCWRRAFLVNRRRPGRALATVRPFVTEARLWELLPADAEWWLRFAETTPNIPLRAAAIDKVIATGLKGGSAPSAQSAIVVAKAELLRSNAPAAVSLLTDALSVWPADADIRLQLSVAHEAAGDLPAACQQIEIARKLAPEREDLRLRGERLKSVQK
jgi:O-antigen ligase/tetratricopeptide (TPR) repeat protein